MQLSVSRPHSVHTIATVPLYACGNRCVRTAVCLLYLWLSAQRGVHLVEAELLRVTCRVHLRGRTGRGAGRRTGRRWADARSMRGGGSACRHQLLLSPIELNPIEYTLFAALARNVLTLVSRRCKMFT